MANEVRLIDVDKAKKDFNLHFGGVSHAVIANKILDEQPTVDAVEVVHGRWVDILSWKYGWKCSECDRMVESRENYCPNCGAKMDGERRTE